MSEISHSDELVTKQDLSNFYQGILPYLGGMPDVVGGGFAPVGTIIAFMGTTAPQDYLACDGATYNIADYPQLTAFFAAQFGSVNKFGGDGVTTFKVPDLRGEFLRGTGANSHANQGSGSNVGTHQDGTIHSRAFADANNITVTGKELVTDWLGSYSDDNYNYFKYVKGTEKSSGSKTRFTSRPTNTSVLYCIKAIESGQVYSTEERIIGTWLDGRPLYQKTVIVNSPASAGVDTIVASFDANVQPREMVGLLDNTIPLNYNGASDWYVKTRIEPSFSNSVVTAINIRMIVAGYTNRVTRITIRYTKS